MASTIDMEEFQSSLDQFETWFGISFEDFAELETSEQEEILYTKAANVDSEDVYSWADDTFSKISSLMGVYTDMIENGDSLSQAQGAVYQEDLSPLFDTISEFSSLWGEQVTRVEGNTQTSDGTDATFTVPDDPYAGEEWTVDLSTTNTDLIIADPNAPDPYMFDSDGDGYKDTVFYSSANTDQNVVNTDGNTVNIDTDNDGDVDKNDGVNVENITTPTCTLDMNGGTWELIDYDPETETFRIKVTTGTDPDFIESYINVVGPCDIAIINGTAPSETTLRTYNQDAMYHFKTSADSTTTLGDLMYGEVETTGSESATYFLDSANYANNATITPTAEQFTASATVTVNFEAGVRDDVSIDCQNADATFEWQGSDLYMTLTNEDGESITYIFKNFETVMMNGLDADKSDFLHLSNVDISEEEMAKLCNMAPGYAGDTNGDGVINGTDTNGDGVIDADEAESNSSAIYHAYSVAYSILLTDEASDTGEDGKCSVYGIYNEWA